MAQLPSTMAYLHAHAPGGRGRSQHGLKGPQGPMPSGGPKRLAGKRHLGGSGSVYAAHGQSGWVHGSSGASMPAGY